MSWRMDAPLETLSDAASIKKYEELWNSEDLGGISESNHPVPMVAILLIALTIVTAFMITMPIWGQRPTAYLYEPYVESMDKPEVLAAKSDAEAMQIIVAMNKGTSRDALLERHPLTMNDLRLIKDQILSLKQKGVDLKDYTVVGDHVVLANFEGNYRPDGTRIRQQPFWDKGFTIDVFYVSYFVLSVFIMIKRLPPVTWQPRRTPGRTEEQAAR